ncbi:DNA/RNA non-specific endonuclease (plasmid) [Rhizobium sp. CB3171]|uniref:DNA/RNA non-specific endonuclease n=1 Tax=Rhizobium sp. CB3171 TaxID=3039157 RepID=UPI0024B1C0A0|nr:DNA/RNA non-specific endonuclease [Rhizobium sp. CB3171]WFU07269.1 DNA/RNA non-specific endonuclease [Rhizobium sp. CB3171]
MESKTVIRVRPATWFANPPRPGYIPGFLGQGSEVPLPKIPEALAGDVVKLSDNTTELKYMHYSVVMSASRQLAWFSAVNIDGSVIQRLARTDRNPDRPEAVRTRAGELEAADVWWFDGRLSPDAQVGGIIYDGTDFDYGHLTRRLDPVWGDDRTVRIANDDTFYMTNCTPQAHRLNSRLSCWCRTR